MIELQNIHVRYGTQTVLNGITTAFPCGQVTGIVGPNGCGKSTLLKTITGLCTPEQGQVLIGGTNITKLSSQEIAQQVAYLPQSRAIPSLSVERLVLHGRFPYLSYPRKYRKEDYAIAREALRWVDAEALSKQNLSDLSGGQRQKVYIAMSLAQDTETILMDEPTTYLDIRNQMEILSIARKLADMGKAVVLVLHDLDSVLRCADNIILMRDGIIAVQGNAEQVFHSGEIERSFGITLQRVQTDSGIHYIPELM